MEFNDLPTDKIVEICEHMDYDTLIAFIQTSKEYYDVCNSVLTQRNKAYNKIIDEILDMLSIKSENSNSYITSKYMISLESPLEREFRLATSKWYNYSITEIPDYEYDDTSYIAKYGDGNNFISTDDINRLRSILLDMLRHGIITGRYTFRNP